MFPVIIFPVVLNGNCICQFIICQEIPIAVIDIAAGTLYLLGLLDLKLVIVQIFLPLHDLKVEYPLHQYCGHDTE